MHNYSIIPLDTDHVEEICQDIKRQYEDGIATLALFMMAISPEGNPAIDKADILCKKYDLFRDRLAEMGLECGILAQATIGHGRPLNNPFTFQPLTQLTTGNETTTCCPYDENFREFFRGQFETLASHRPKLIMVDDDFRLMGRPGKGCACPIHMAKVRELIGNPTLTREELYDAIFVKDDKEIRAAFVESQRESLVGAARAYREGIDRVDPKLQGAFCVCGGTTEFGLEIGQILAGEGNPSIIRVSNGRYSQDTTHGFTSAMIRAARNVTLMRGADVLLAETDTCPQNRYSTSAYSLHTHFTGTILEGVAGAKHWITRTRCYEPKSGRMYRKVLSMHAGFYDALSALVPKLSWRGCRIPVPSEPQYLPADAIDNGWRGCVLERMGFPMYFSAENGGVLFLDGTDDRFISDEEIMKALSGSMFISAESVQRLTDRGFGEYLGASVREWTGENPTGELFCDSGKNCTRQVHLMELVPADGAVTHSVVYHVPDGETKKPIFPAVLSYKNKLGGTVVSFCGTPKAKFNIFEAYSFLNESRKNQMVKLLSECGELPVWYTGDAEVYFRAADIAGTNDMLAALFNMGLDVLTELELASDKPAKKIERLMPDGSFAQVDFEMTDEGFNVNTQAGVLDPVILRLSF